MQRVKDGLIDASEIVNIPRIHAHGTVAGEAYLWLSAAQGWFTRALVDYSDFATQIARQDLERS